MDFATLFKKAFDNGASDIHLQAGQPPIFRVHGSLIVDGDAAVAQEDMAAQLRRMVPQHLIADLTVDVVKGLDFSYTQPGAGRFRCSAFQTLGKLGMTMRTIKAVVPSLEELNLPSAVMDIALAQRGLTLVTGTTGSGKSTTLAAMINLLNTNYDLKILTVEDPIEYVYS